MILNFDQSFTDGVHLTPAKRSPDEYKKNHSAQNGEMRAQNLEILELERTLSQGSTHRWMTFVWAIKMLHATLNL